MSALLEVEDLRVQLETRAGPVQAVDGVSYSVDSGRTLGIIGDAGSGKTAAALAILGLTESVDARISGRVRFDGRDLLALGPAALRAIRGGEIGMAFQDALASLHPLLTLGAQVIETVVAHREGSKAAARDRAVDLLELVGIPDPHLRVDQYPGQVSTEVHRRATLAIALANEPKLLIADEPMAGVDAAGRAQIAQLLDRVQRRLAMAMIVISRDLESIRELADEVCVFSAGRIVERLAQSSSST